MDRRREFRRLLRSIAHGWLGRLAQRGSQQRQGQNRGTMDQVVDGQVCLLPEKRIVPVRQGLDEFLLEVRVARLDRRRHPLFIQPLRAIDLGAQPVQ